MIGADGVFTTPFTNSGDFSTIAGGMHLYSIRRCFDSDSLVGIQLKLSESDTYGSAVA